MTPRDDRWIDSPSALYREGRITFEDIWTASPAMKKSLQRARLAAPHEIDLLLLGETGTGKNLVAQAIHTASPRARKPFVAVNVAAIPTTLLASELFGSEEGAFSGAKARRGHFEQAHGGTLFLDEIGNLDPECQQKLLTAVESKRVWRLGAEQPIDCDVRVISATNLDMREAVEVGKFRRDLYHRIAQVEIQLPPLGKRPEDIEMLAERFLDQANEAFGRQVEKIGESCMARMLSYEWPGNVRELRGRINAAMIECLGRELRLGDIFPELADDGEPETTQPGMELALETVERRHIAKVLRLTGWNRTRAAELLRISRPTLYEKMRKYGLEPPSSSD